MFQGIINKLKEVFSKMMNKGTVQEKMQVDVSISNDMIDAIDRFINIYQNNPPWRDDSKGIYSMNLGAGIASEFAKLVTIEFKSEISNNEFLNKEYQVVIDNIRNNVELACAGGGIIFKPYLSNGHIEVDVVQADSIYPVSFNSRGEMTAVILPETKTIGDWTYTRMEYHSLEGTEYTIINKAFKKKNYNTNIAAIDQLGEEIALTEVEEWKNLAPVPVIFHNVEKPLFAYFKMPNKNTIDLNSPLGVSIYERVSGINGLLQKADEQYSRIDWEYKASELAIDVSRDMLKPEYDDNGNMIGDGLPQGKERLYRRLDIDPTADKTSGWNVFSPQIRDVSLYNGLQHILRNIEFLVGLAYGTISDPNETDKTAEEIKSSKQRSYQTVKDIQNNLRIALETLAYAMAYLGNNNIGKLGTTPIDIEKDISFNFDDSVVVDKKSELDSMFGDVSANIIKPKFYIMKKYGVDEKTAEEMAADAPEIKTSLFPTE